MTTPMLFISGRHDQLIPCSQMDELYHKAESSKYVKMLQVPSGDHNDTWIQDTTIYFKYMNDFMRK